MSDYIPTQMNPVDRLGPTKAVYETATCCGCGNVIPVAVGLLYERMWPVKEGVQYGAVFFCSFECILDVTPVDGRV